MSWTQRYKVRSYLRSSLWIIPVLAGVAERAFRAIVELIEARTAWAGFELGVEGARALSNTVITLSLSFVVFTFGSLLVAIQVASGQYTPRIIATLLLRDNVIRYTVALFVFTLLFSVRAINHIEGTVPQLSLCIIGFLGLICLAAFLFLIDYAARLLRPVSLVKHVGDDGLRVIESFYPDKVTKTIGDAVTPQNAGPVDLKIMHRGRSAIILAVDVRGLIEEAKRSRVVIELGPQVGDFVGEGEPLFLLHGSALAFVEIRHYGASNVQIARRLRAMIVNLSNTLPAVRHAALRQEFELLDRVLEKLYVLPEDLALARIPDSQGLGESSDATAPKWAS